MESEEATLDRPTVVIQRLDAGETDNGSFRCTAPGCSWSLEGTMRAARKHANHSHHASCRTERVVPLHKPTEEEKKRKAAERTRRWAQKKKGRDGAYMFDELEYPMAVGDGEPPLMIKATKEPGEGQRRLAGSLADDTRQSWDVAISFVAINAKRLRSWATGVAMGTCHANLYTDKEDLTVSVGNLSGPKDGSSAGACAALALLKVLAPIKLVGELVAVTGTLDLRGRVGPVGGIKEKLSTVYDKGFSVMVVPQETHDEILEARETEEWDPALREAADKIMKPAADFVDVMELAVRGFRRGDNMAMLLDGPHVGVGLCPGYYEDDVRPTEFQACWVSPGKQNLILTGSMSQVTRDAIYIVKALVVEHTPALRVLFRRPSMRLVRPKFALHIHLCHLEEPLKPSYQMAAIYVAMISLMTGKRPWADVAVFGSVSNIGTLSSMWEWTAKSFKFCHFCGIRRVVLADKTKVGEEARRAAMELDPDGKPKVEIFLVKTIMEALPLLFDMSEETQMDVPDGADG